MGFPPPSSTSSKDTADAHHQRTVFGLLASLLGDDDKDDEDDENQGTTTTWASRPPPTHSNRGFNNAELRKEKNDLWLGRGGGGGGAGYETGSGDSQASTLNSNYPAFGLGGHRAHLDIGSSEYKSNALGRGDGDTSPWNLGLDVASDGARDRVHSFNSINSSGGGDGGRGGLVMGRDTLDNFASISLLNQDDGHLFSNVQQNQQQFQDSSFDFNMRKDSPLTNQQLYQQTGYVQETAQYQQYASMSTDSNHRFESSNSVQFQPQANQQQFQTPVNQTYSSQYVQHDYQREDRRDLQQCFDRNQNYGQSASLMMQQPQEISQQQQQYSRQRQHSDSMLYQQSLHQQQYQQQQQQQQLSQHQKQQNWQSRPSSQLQSRSLLPPQTLQTKNSYQASTQHSQQQQQQVDSYRRRSASSSISLSTQTYSPIEPSLPTKPGLRVTAQEYKPFHDSASSPYHPPSVTARFSSSSSSSISTVSFPTPPLTRRSSAVTISPPTFPKQPSRQSPQTPVTLQSLQAQEYQPPEQTPVAPLVPATAAENVAQMIRERNLNPPLTHFEPRHPNARFFIIKSFREDHIYKSIKHSVWSSTEIGNKRLHQAYLLANPLALAPLQQPQSTSDSSKPPRLRASTAPVSSKPATQTGGPIYLFFSVNGSGHFCGLAEMTSPVSPSPLKIFSPSPSPSTSSTQSSSSLATEYTSLFSVRWIYIRDIPNQMLRHLRVPANEGKAVTNSRDTQEVLGDVGWSMVEIFGRACEGGGRGTCLLDDWGWYEGRENGDGK
ncbi:hypothetical protein HDU79_000554 [Rhizoclosmatium sp. JEL0117]|nr:hypothetical protein HDU79_000554 [Rhizoclosmatium sp. JEL0117]